ncbi:MAG: hypothetical protein QOC56_1458 [Alphaproteobacteria bacterium]|nr:hypothetical protein [Alphaproteobacteria bacterium]
MPTTPTARPLTRMTTAQAVPAMGSAGDDPGAVRVAESFGGARIGSMLASGGRFAAAAQTSLTKTPVCAI